LHLAGLLFNVNYDARNRELKKNSPKHVEFHSKNKFEKLKHLVGFIIRFFYDARSPERQI